jgi:sphinganine-1-phosphate aldolase
MQLPPNGLDNKTLLKLLEEAKGNDADWRRGRAFSLVYYGDDEHSEFLKAVHGSFFYENGLSPKAFPSLLHMEREVVSMLLNLMGAPSDSGGNMTSGGTESILLAVKTYRDRALALNPKLTRPQMVAPESAHPSFFKAAHYFGLEAVSVPVDENFQADPAAMARAITDRTILLAASAPSFPQGVVDPIPELGELALASGVGLHVDACLGGFFLPFLAGLGRECPPWDLSVPGVSSISADLHKYGYAAKGASALLFRDTDLWRYQFHVDTRWSGGVYASSTMLGTRPGGTIAAAWAALMSQGYDGYQERVRLTLELTEKVQSGLAELGLKLLGKPVTGVFAVASDEFDLLQAAEKMAQRDWWLDCLNHPPSLHMIITPNHAQSIDQFLGDLARVLPLCRISQNSEQRKQAMLYGMTSDITPEGDPESRLLQGLLTSYQPDPSPQQASEFDLDDSPKTELRLGDFQLPKLPTIISRGETESAELLGQVCRSPEIRPLASGSEIMLDKALAEPFKVCAGKTIKLNPGFVKTRPAASLHLRHALELGCWLELSGADSSLEAAASAALLACRVAAVFRQSRLKAEQDLMTAGSPAWLNRAMDMLSSINKLSPDNSHELIASACDLLRLLDMPGSPNAQELRKVWDQIHERLCGAWEIAATTEHLLTTGGDSRLTLNKHTGLNNYGCSPRPRPWAVTFASSTASSISDLAFVRAENARLDMMAQAWQGDLHKAFSQSLADIRKELAEFWIGARDYKAIITNSGTDAELIALHIALCGGEQPLRNILVASEETGSGVRLAAQGRYFASQDIDGNQLQKGSPVDGIRQERISLESFPARSTGASMLPTRILDDQVEEAVNRAIASGARVLLHLVDSSKTGISVPSLSCLDQLLAVHGPRLDVVVDACQLRLSRFHMSEYLRRGCMVVITGSKFYTGPPFSGAMLVPAKYYDRIKRAGSLPAGLGRFSSRYEWPRSWTAAQSLPPRRNLGLMLRWKAALWELRAFHAVSPSDRFSILSSFGWEVLAAILRNPDLRLVSFPVPPRPAGRDLVVWDRLPTIFTFAPLLRSPGGGVRPLTPEEARQVYHWLNTDISAMLPPGTADAEISLAAQRFHIGQPVEMMGRQGEKMMALRLSAGARLVSGVAYDPALGPAAPQRLEAETRDALAALKKISLILHHFNAITQRSLDGSPAGDPHMI